MCKLLTDSRRNNNGSAATVTIPSRYYRPRRFFLARILSTPSSPSAPGLDKRNNREKFAPGTNTERRHGRELTRTVVDCSKKLDAPRKRRMETDIRCWLSNLNVGRVIIYIYIRFRGRACTCVCLIGISSCTVFAIKTEKPFSPTVGIQYRTDTTRKLRVCFRTAR